MKRIHVVSTALIALTVAGSTVVQAQGRSGRSDPRAQRDQQRQGDPRAQRTSHDQAARDPREQRAQPAPAPVQREQQRGVDEQRERNDQARRIEEQRDQQSRVVRQQAEELQEARRAADYRAQQEYAERVEQQRLRNERNYAIESNIEASRYYRYNVGGIYHQTNQYGVDLLRQAVNNGYLEGVQAGESDRQNRWPASYQNSRAYRDADDGFGGINFNYVDRSDYTYYFRQGFQRGYDDGYYGRSQYGSYSNGAGAVLGSILGGILGLELIR